MERSSGDGRSLRHRLVPESVVAAADLPFGEGIAAYPEGGAESAGPAQQLGSG